MQTLKKWQPSLLASCLAFSVLQAFAADDNPPAATSGAQPQAQAAVGDAQLKSTESAKDPHFLDKLNDMYNRTETSIKLLREQITQNQSAPFLADLYLQLGDLLSEKSTALYYIQMERDKNTDLKVAATKKFSPVVTAQQEAIIIYEKILKEFPKFDKKNKVLYRLAVGQKSIDEGPAFVETAEKLIQGYPEERETMQVRLLVGQYFFDMHDNNKCVSYLLPVVSSPYPYERDAARYRIGLVRILEEKHAEALKLFEAVATDNDLKEEDNPNEISLKNKTAKSNIKREALIDSVRAYTEVYKENPDPVKYYARVAPTEVLFQETIEKLAFRYIFLRKYNFAINLLRTLAERTADPQKIVNVYHEVLLMIPINDRLEIPVQEMQFVLDRYDYWATHYNLTPDLQKKAQDFFETQIRELGTRAHDLAKTEKDPKKKAHLLERARSFYLLYLGFFDKGPISVKIATNLADVYFSQANYFKSGSYYLRIFSGEFGPAKDKEALIQNAILALQKPAEYTFYEQLRVKGLLVKSILSYQAYDKRQKNTPDLNFTLAKTFYEQGFYDRALNDLLQFMKQFPNSKEVEAAADLILDYFNTRNDVKGIVEWSQKMLALNPKSSTLRAHLEEVHSKGLLKRLDEQVKSQKDYDMFAQGKSYLQTALSSGDSSLRSAAFEQALARSRAEKDIPTFIKAATAMGRSEQNPQKRAALLNSLADETLAITRFHQTLDLWGKIMKDPGLSNSVRQEAFEKSVKLALVLRDSNRLGPLAVSPQMRSSSPQTKSSVGQQLASMSDTPVDLPPALYNAAINLAGRDEDWISIFKAQFKMPASYRQIILKSIVDHCKGVINSNLCRWNAWSSEAQNILAFGSGLQAMPKTLTSIEPAATKLNGLLDQLKTFENSGDPQLDILISLGTGLAYGQFGQFLQETAKANPEVTEILMKKAEESLVASKRTHSQCEAIVAAANIVMPTAGACNDTHLPSLSEAFNWSRPVHMPIIESDPLPQDVSDLQKKIFVERKDWRPYFDLAELYLSKNLLAQAAATAVYGSSTFSQSQEEFNAILGCAVLKMGFVNEAQFHLKKASDLNGHKQECLSLIKNEVRAK